MAKDIMTYQEQLNDPRWKEKREEIIRLNWGYCSICGTSKNIQVHHKRYIPGLMAWEYDNQDLTTLCLDCHSLEHNKVPIDRKPRHIKNVMIDIVKGMIERFNGK